MGVGFIAELIYSPIKDRGPGYSLPDGGEAQSAEVAAPEASAPPLGVLLASAVVEQGQNAARKCQACHNLGEGEANKVGPALYNVVGRVIGSHEGFAYSQDMQAHKAAGDAWSYEELDAFLAAPKTVMPGTKMAFAGVKTAEERANILAYLATLSSSPVPFPPSETAAAEAPAEATAATEAPATPAEAPAATEAPATPAEAPAAAATEAPAAPAASAAPLGALLASAVP